MHKTCVILFCLLFFARLAFAMEVDREKVKRTYPMYPDFVTNLMSGAEDNYISVRVNVLTPDEETPKIIEYYEPLLRDSIILILNSKTIFQLQNIQQRVQIVEEIERRIKSLLEKELGIDIVEKIGLSRLILE